MQAPAGPGASHSGSNPKLRIVGSSGGPTTTTLPRSRLPTIAGPRQLVPPSSLVQASAVLLLAPSGFSPIVGYRFEKITSCSPTRTIRGPPLSVLNFGSSPVPYDFSHWRVASESQAVAPRLSRQ